MVLSSRNSLPTTRVTIRSIPTTVLH